MISKPTCAPRRVLRPNSGGNWPTDASIRVSPPEAYSVALTEEVVASSAATAIIVNPASPSAGRAASAIAVSPYSITSSTVRVPKTPSEIRMYSPPAMPSAVYIAIGRPRGGSARSPAENVITLNPMKAKNVSATLAMMSESGG